MFDKKEKTILIVDDTPENLDILREFLSDYNLNIAINGKTALKILEMQSHPDLILLDIMMPELNGFQVCEILKNDPSTRDIPIIFITSLTDIADIIKSFELGAVDYITKPFNPAEVKKRVETHINLRSYQKRLENMNLILEQKVQKRTAELQKLNSELIIAKNKAEEINKLKSFFIANISHEFRTPLIAILGFSEIMGKETENPEHVEFCEMIFESGQRLHRTLNDIIALTELENKKLELFFKRVNIIEALNKSKELYLNSALKKGLEFKLIYKFDELWVITDEVLLKYILDHLVNNAIKFTDTGEITVTLSESKENSLEFLIIQISDTGIGIAEEKLNLIFSSFRQESEGYNKSHEGLGLGLTVSKQLVYMLKGDISIISKVGEGTTVTLKFPLTQKDEDIVSKINQAKRLLNNRQKSMVTSQPSVLLVEDNESNRILLRKILKDDFIVDEAIDGIGAVAMAETKTYDLILMDINLGAGIDGIEAMKRIRKLPDYDVLPIIALTAYAMKEDRERFIEYGFSDFIQKPVLKEEFLSLLRQFVFGR